MKQRELGTTGVKVSEISLGCWTMGGLNWVNGTPNGWANVDEAEVTAAIKMAVDQGVNHFDNADVYGNGRAERMLARSFNSLGLNTNDYIIATKIGHFPGTAEHAYHPAHIRHQCEQSLINLQRDHIDVYYFHHGDFGPDRVWLEGAAEVMNRLIEEGKVRIKAQSAYSDKDFLETAPVVQPSVFQSWASALDDRFIREGSPVSDYMKANHITFVAFSPLAQGRLLGKYNPNQPPSFEEGDNRNNKAAFSAEGLAELQPKIDQFKARFGGEVEDLAAMALNYLLAHDTVACAIPGFRNERQVACNLAAKDRDFTADDLEFVRTVVSS